MIIRYRTWKELLKAVKKFECMGIKCEVKDWNDMRYNKLTVYAEQLNEQN